MGTGTVGRGVTFARAARCYWLEVFPFVRRELREWRRRAEAIPEPGLRRDALLALETKSRNAEGLAAFAVLAPQGKRRAVIRVAVAYQTALQYLDNLTEHRSHPYADKLKLNRVLEVAVDSERSLESFREETRQRGDHEYLSALIDACRGSLGELPSYAAALGLLRRRASLGAEAQAMNHSLLLDADEMAMARWADAVALESSLEGQLRWWEMVAAGASTPAVGALIALAARPAVGEVEFLAVDTAYFPWVNTLNTLLDSLVDLDEDPPQQRHIRRYSSSEDAAERLAAIAARAHADVGALAGGQLHELIFAAMGGYYLAQPAAWVGERRTIAAAVAKSLGPFARSTLAVHRLRQGGLGTALRPEADRRNPEALAS